MATTVSSDITETKFAGVHLIPTDKLRASRYQIRHEAFDDVSDFKNLVESIKTVGLIEIPSVRRVSDGKDGFAFEIITGHRRIRAATKHLGWKQVKCKVYDDMDEFTALFIALTENIQRSNLSPYEEGMSYVTCQRIFGLSDSQMAQQLHRASGTVVSRKQFANSTNNCLKYLDNSDSGPFLRNYTFGHYEALSCVKDVSQIRKFVYLIKDGITVKELKSMIARTIPKPAEKAEESAASPRIRGRSNKTELVNRLRWEIERLKEEAPDGFRSRIYLIEDIFDEINSLDKRDKTAASLWSSYLNKKDGGSSRETACPSCGKTLRVERRVNEKEKSVLFLIHKAEDEVEISSSVVSFPKIL